MKPTPSVYRCFWSPSCHHLAMMRPSKAKLLPFSRLEGIRQLILLVSSFGGCTPERLTIVVGHFDDDTVRNSTLVLGGVRLTIYILA